jgi:hypothetical protein
MYNPCHFWRSYWYHQHFKYIWLRNAIKCNLCRYHSNYKELRQILSQQVEQFTLYKITEFYTEWLSICPDIISKFSPPPHSKAPSKKIEVVGMSMIFHCPILRLSKGSGLWRLRKQNVNLNFQLPVMIPRPLLFVAKVVLLKCIHLLKIYPHIKFHSSTLTCKFCIHLRSLNVHNIGMVDATGLKIVALRAPSMTLPSCWI